MSTEMIKSSLTLLCKLCNLLHNVNLKAEYFRLAKFNKTDENVIPILWNALFKILNVESSLTVKQKLHGLNYKRSKFYQITEEDPESRELVLALGFVLTCFEEIINNEIEYSYSVLFENLISKKNIMTNGHLGFNWKKLSDTELENYKKWISGKIYSNINTVTEYKHHIEKIKIKFSGDKNIKENISVYELLALKNDKVGQQFLQDTEPVVNLLSLYTEWLKKEKHFWKWMQTVIQEGNK